ncbi:MAG: hypothetical protein WDO13_08990 [Verrucomicrobiota bacterium]
MSSDLRRVADFLRLAHQTLAVVNQNMLGGLAFIGLALLLSAAGYIPPIAAAFLHEARRLFRDLQQRAPPAIRGPPR